jgi:hypothetical protein
VWNRRNDVSIGITFSSTFPSWRGSHARRHWWSRAFVLQPEPITAISTSLWSKTIAVRWRITYSANVNLHLMLRLLLSGAA